MSERMTAEQEQAIRACFAVVVPGVLPGSYVQLLLDELDAVRAENATLKKAARSAYFAMPMCVSCWSNDKPKRFVAARHLHFQLSGDGPPLTWPSAGVPRVFGYCDKHKHTECSDGFVEFHEWHQVDAIAELEALGMPEVTG